MRWKVVVHWAIIIATVVGPVSGALALAFTDGELATPVRIIALIVAAFLLQGVQAHWREAMGR